MKTLGILLTTFFLLPTLTAQVIVDDTKTIPILVFENFEKKDSRFIKEGATIKYKLRGDKRTAYLGKLENITEKTMTVGGKVISYANCSMIKGRVRTDKEMLGGVLAGIGFTAMGFGVGLFGVTSSGAIGAATAGASFFGVGLAFMFNKKVFNMDKGWEVHGGSIQYNQAQ